MRCYNCHKKITDDTILESPDVLCGECGEKEVMTEIQRLAILVQDRNEQISKLRGFIENLETQTDNFDKICDCGQDMQHDANCMTSKARIDLSKIHGQR